MTSEQVVGYLLEDKGLDFLRESLAWVVQQWSPTFSDARPAT